MNPVRILMRLSLIPCGSAFHFQAALETIFSKRDVEISPCDQDLLPESLTSDYNLRLSNIRVVLVLECVAVHSLVDTSG